MLKEIWIQIDEFPNYEVSNYGNVRNKTNKKNLKAQIRSDKYVQVTLYNNGSRRTVKVHRIVCSSFFENWNDDFQIIHIDKNRSNNYIENLKVTLDTKELTIKTIPIITEDLIEEWRPVKENPRYNVSSLGRVRSYFGKIVTQYTTEKGYKQVTLSLSGTERITRLVHRLVAEAFLNDWDENLTVDHIDYDPKNNTVNNLRMLTFRENCLNKKQS